jgi:hypothetical protein
VAGGVTRCGNCGCQSKQVVAGMTWAQYRYRRW